MRRVIRTKQSGQVLGSILCLAGFAALFTVFWKAWPQASASSDAASSLWGRILTEEINLASMVTVKLVYLTTLGTIFLVLGIVVLGFSRQVFYVSGESVWLHCPYCKNSWKARRAVGWAECPHCRKFIQPQTKKTAT